MEIMVIFLIAFIVGFSGAIMPGPLLAVTIGETIKQGFIAGPLIVLGHGILELILITALVLGLASFLTTSVATLIVSLGGGLFLLYFGFSQIHSFWSNQLSLNLEKSKALNENELEKKFFPGHHLTTKVYLVWAGILVSLSNPYWSVWWITIGLSYITIALKQGFLGLASFFSGHILADLTWYCLIAGIVTKGQKFFPPRVYRGTMLICGLFLIGLGAYFIIRQAFGGAGFQPVGLLETYFKLK